MNEFYKMPPLPPGVEEGILKGIYRFKASELTDDIPKAHLLGSGSILNEALKAQEVLEEKYNVSADVWSVTSYKELYHDAISVERRNLLNPDKEKEKPYIARQLSDGNAVYVAASDYLKALPGSLAQWIPGRTIVLGTDGFGRSDNRAALRDFFEVDYRFIALAVLHMLSLENKISADIVKKAIKELDINPDKPNPIFI